MNTLEMNQKYVSLIKGDFESNETIKLADIYCAVRVDLNSLYKYLPEKD